MHDFFVNLFREDTVTNEITLYSGWHFMYIIAIVGLSIAMAFIFKNKSEKAKDTVLNILAYCIAGVYIADFFIMPLAFGSISYDKLPFHICTLMGVFAPFAQFNKKFEPIKHVIVVFSLISSIMWVTYPGSALGGIGAFSYKCMQTFAYHGLLIAWGFLNLAFGKVKLDFKNIWKELVGLCIIAVWAYFGNYTYSDNGANDWFFVTGNSYPFIPKWLMPFVVITCTFAMCAIIYGLYYAVKAICLKIEAKKASKTSTPPLPALIVSICYC